MLPKRPLTDIDLKQFAQDLPYFRGVFMRNTLPKRVRSRECGIINLDSNHGSGTHWVAYHKNKNHIEYFDSFGNLQPPKELIKYLGKNIHYNYTQEQIYGTYNCGHLCLNFLFQITEEEEREKTKS